MVKPGYSQKLGKRQAEYYRKTRETLLAHYDKLTDRNNPGARHILRDITQKLEMLADEFDPPEADLSDL